jgi:hypothetical protein
LGHPHFGGYECSFHPTFLRVFFLKTRGVSCCALAIYIKKYIKAKEEELWKLKCFTMQNYNVQKSLLKKQTKIPSR